MTRVLDSIYLNKRGHNQDSRHWACYRVTSLGGDVGDHIRVCLVQWPSFSDIDVVGDVTKSPVVNPADTGYNSALPNLVDLLTKKWNIDHEQSILIGARERPAYVGPQFADKSAPFFSLSPPALSSPFHCLFFLILF